MINLFAGVLTVELLKSDVLCVLRPMIIMINPFCFFDVMLFNPAVINFHFIRNYFTIVITKIFFYFSVGIYLGC